MRKSRNGQEWCSHRARIEWHSAGVLETRKIVASENPGRRLMIVLHGLGDTWEGWSWLPGELNVPWLDYLLVNAPIPYWEGRAWFSVQPSDLMGPRVRPPQVPKEELAAGRHALMELIDAQIQGGYASDQIALLGFSQGCLMALDAGLHRPEPLAALIGISGWIHDVEGLIQQCSGSVRSTPILMTHGAADSVIPMGPVAEQARRLQQAGFNLVWQEFEKEHTVAGRAEVQFLARFLTAAYAGDLRES